MTPILIPLVNVPNGSVGGETGQIGVTTTGSVMEQVSPIQVEGTKGQGDTGFGQSSFYNQILFSEVNPLNQATSSLGAGIQLNMHADHTSIDGVSTLATDGHAIESQLDALIVHSQEGATSNVVRDSSNVDESNVSIDGTLIDESAIGIANGQIGGETSSPSGNGTSANFAVLDLNQFPLLPFENLDDTVAQVFSDKGPNVLSIVTASLAKSEDQQNQSALQHNLSFGSQTVPTDRNLVNHFAALAPGAPSGASIDPSTGGLTWAVPRTQAVGLYTIAVTVTDAATPALMGQ